MRDEHGVHVSAGEWQINDLLRIDHLRYGRLQWSDSPSLRFKRTRPISINVRAVEGYDRLCPGEKNAPVLARFPNVAERPQQKIEIQPGRHGEHQFIELLTLIIWRADTDGVRSW